MQREEVDLADRAPVGAHLRDHARRQGDLRQPLEHPLAVPGVHFVIVEDQLQIGKPEEREGAQVRDVRDAVHGDFQRDGDLLLDLFGGNSRPLRDDLDVVVGHVGIGFDGKLMEGDRSPAEEQDGRGEHEKAILQGEIDEFGDHFSVPLTAGTTVPPCSRGSARRPRRALPAECPRALPACCRGA